MFNKIFKHLCVYYLKILAMFHIGILFIIYIADFTEGLKKYSEYNPSIGLVGFLSLLKLPQLLIDLSPFIILFASLFAIRTLVLHKEIDILKACGLSIWKILNPFILLTIIYGLLLIFVLNPLVFLSTQYEEIIENKIIPNKESNIYLKNNILWIIDKIDTSEKNIIMAKRFISINNKIHLNDITIFHIKNNKLLRLLNAYDGMIDRQNIYLNKVLIKNENESFFHSNNTLNISLHNKSNKLSNLNLNPSNIIIYNYPQYIYNLKKIGVDTSDYEFYFYNLISLPLLLFAMLLISVRFSLYDIRAGKNLYIITITILCGFLLYFFSNIINTFGASNHIPIYLDIAFTKTTIILLSLLLLVKKEGV